MLSVKTEEYEYVVTEELAWTERPLTKNSKYGAGLLPKSPAVNKTESPSQAILLFAEEVIVPFGKGCEIIFIADEFTEEQFVVKYATTFTTSAWLRFDVVKETDDCFGPNNTPFLKNSYSSPTADDVNWTESPWQIVMVPEP